MTTRNQQRPGAVGVLAVLLVAIAAAALAIWDVVFASAQRTPVERGLRGIVVVAAFSTAAIVFARLVAALRASEDRWRNVFENNPTMYFMVDPSGVVLSVNPTGAEQLGYTVAELVGRPVSSVFFEDDRAAAARHVERCLMHLGESLSWELRKVRRDGSMLWVRETARAVRLGGRAVVLIACEDVTERKRAEERLRRSESYLAAAQRVSGTGSFGWNAPDGALYWSEETYRIFDVEPGTPPSTDIVLARTHPEDRADVGATIERARRDLKDFEHEYRLQLPDGTEKHLHVVACMMPVGSDAHEFVGAIMDVTAQRQAEEARQAHLWFLESMDRVNRVLHGTNDVEQMLDAALEAIRTIFDADRVVLLHPCDPDAPEYRVVVARARPEYPMPRATGSWVPAFAEDARVARVALGLDGPMQLRAATDPPLSERTTRETGAQSALIMALYPKVDAPYMLAMAQCSHPRIWTPQEERLFQEIARRLADTLTIHLALQDVRESAQRYRNIFQTAAVSIWEQDFSRVQDAIDGLKAVGVVDFRRYFAEHPEFVERAIGLIRVVDVNDATLSLYKARDKAEFLSSMRQVFTPDTFAAFAEQLVAVAERRPWFSAESTAQTLDGDRLHILFTVAFPPDATRLDSVLVSIMDVTARRRAEDALQRAQADLARVSTMTTMGELAASIAHELRQPLAAIVMDGSAALRWLNREPPNTEEARAAAARTVREAQRADDVIRGLRALLGNGGLQRRTFDLNEAIREVVELVRGELRRGGVVVQMELASHLPAVSGDRVQVQQVLLNLVLNGAEAMGSIVDRPRELVIRTDDVGTEVAVAVEDSGVGLDSGTRDRIFDPFFTTKPNGLGMGLSICRSVVEAHGGQLSVSPNAPYGTRFRFTISSVAPVDGAASEGGIDAAPSGLGELSAT